MLVVIEAFLINAAYLLDSKKEKYSIAHGTSTDSEPSLTTLNFNSRNMYNLEIILVN